MAGKIYEVAFQLAGKVGSSFHSTFLSANRQLSRLDSQIKKVKADMKAGGNKSELQAQLDGLTAQKNRLTAAQAASEKFRKSVESAFKTAAIAAGVATTAVTAYYASAMKLANGVMEHAKHARVAAQITGMSAESYESLAYAAKNAGVSTENFDKSLGRMVINLGEVKRGNKAMIEVFADLGISASELSNMRPEQALMRIITALNGVTDAAVKTDLARKIFGKVGTSMIPLANLGAAGIRKLQVEARRMGVVLTEESIKNAKAYQLARNRFNAVFSGTKLTLGQAVMPGLAEGMDTLAKLAVKYQPAIRAFAADLGKGIKQATPEILKTVRALGGVAGAVYRGARAFSHMIGGFHNLVYIAAGWIGLKVAASFISSGAAMVRAGRDAMVLCGHIRNLHIMTVLTTAKTVALGAVQRAVALGAKVWAAAQWALNIAMSANPIGLLIIGIAGLVAAGYALCRNWDTVKAFMVNLWNDPLTAVGAFIQGIRDRFMPLFNWIYDKWNAIKNVFSSTPSAGNSDGSVSVPELPGHADGGIFNREHIARFAEGGKPEAAIPLSAGNRSRGLSLWAQAGQMLGVSNPGRSAGSQRSGGASTFNLTQNITIQGGDVEAVRAGINRANQDAISQFKAWQAEEERLSYA